MIDKLYEGFIKFIKNNLGFIIIIMITFILANINTGYSIYKPGGIINITDRIHVNGESVKSDGSINMAYVGMVEGRLPFYLIAKLIPSWELVKNSDMAYSETETADDMLQRDKLNYLESISNAKYLAYQKSNTAFDIKSEANYITYVNEACTANIKIGDEMLKYDDIEYNSVEDLKEYIGSKNIGDEITLTIIRNSKEIKTSAKVFEEEGQHFIGLSTLKVYEFTSEKKLTIDSKTSEYGPSGGLMLTLAVYNTLTQEDITKGNKIAGTGTIDIEGNVGAIGGVEYKLGGAVKSKADIFIVPNDNLEAALAYAKEQKYDIIIKGVSTFDEALEILKNLEEKK